MGLDALAAKRQLELTSTALQQTRTALTKADLPAAREAAARARTSSQAALGRTDGPMWATLARLPISGGIAETARASTALAAAAADAAGVVADDGDRLIDGDGRLRVEVKDGAVNLDVLHEANDVLTQINVAAIQTALARLESADPIWLPGGLRATVESASLQATETLEDLDLATRATEALPGFLGGEGRRVYLLALQNPGELRATGGFLGFVSTLIAEDGKLTLGEAQDFDPIGTNADGTEAQDDEGDGFQRAVQTLNRRTKGQPVEAPDDYAARYDSVAGRDWLGNTNLHPDVPTVAPIMQKIWKRDTGQDVDGVILVDPVALVEVLKVTGPLDVPDEVSHPDLADPLTPANLIDTTLTDAYDVLGGRSPERMRYHQVVASRAFGTMFGGDWQPRLMLEALGRAAEGRHLMLWSADPDEEQIWTDIGIDGAFAPKHDADFLGLTAINAARNKADLFHEHQIEIDYEILEIDHETGFALRRATVDITVVNGLTDASARDPYIRNAQWPLPEGKVHIGPDGLTRTWFSVYARASDVSEIDLMDGELHAAPSMTIGEMLVVDGFMIIPNLEKTTFSTTYYGWVPLADDGSIQLDWIPPTSATETVARVRRHGTHVAKTIDLPTSPGRVRIAPAIGGQ